MKIVRNAGLAWAPDRPRLLSYRLTVCAHDVHLHGAAPFYGCPTVFQLLTLTTTCHSIMIHPPHPAWDSTWHQMTGTSLVRVPINSAQTLSLTLYKPCQVPTLQLDPPPFPDRRKFVNELARVCMPGGKIIIVTWCHRVLGE